VPVDDARAANAYWGRAALDRAIIDALAAAGKNLSSLTIDDLAPADQFHGGGKPPRSGSRGSPACARPRRLDVAAASAAPPARSPSSSAAPSPSWTHGVYVSAGRALTALVDLEDRVTHRLGNALALPEDGGPWNVVWTQNSGMNIEDKVRLYAGFSRALRPAASSRCRSPWRARGPRCSRSCGRGMPGRAFSYPRPNARVIEARGSAFALG